MPPTEVNKNVPEKISEQKTEPESVIKKVIKSLRTYQGDVEEALKKTGGSISSIVIAEQKRREKALDLPQEEASVDNNRMYFFIISVILLLIGIVAIVTAYYIQSRKDEVVLEQKTKTLVAYSEEKTLDITGKTRNGLFETFNKEKEKFKMPVNSVLFLNIIENNNSADIEKVINLIAPKIPANLLRSLDKHMFGVYSFDTNEPFIVFTTNDYPISFSGMLDWEKNMVADLGELFGLSEKLGTTTIATFTDEVRKNKDLRVVKNQNNETVLIYAFIDTKTIVITSKETIFDGILSKYLVNQTVR